MVEKKAKDDVAVRLGRNIGMHRRMLGLTQAQLAELFDVDTETLSRFERGKHSPTLKGLVRLAGLLQTTASELLAEEVPQPSQDATVVTMWLESLSQEEKAFVMAMLKQHCDFLSSQRAAVHVGSIAP